MYSHAAELEKQKQTSVATEKLRREKWRADETQRIKEATVKSLEPEIQRIIARGKAEIQKLKAMHEVNKPFNQLTSTVVLQVYIVHLCKMLSVLFHGIHIFEPFFINFSIKTRWSYYKQMRGPAGGSSSRQRN